jgi:dienelactone hydrolase
MRPFGQWQSADVYQQACALAALNGMAALIFDPIDQGERHQLLDDQGKPRLAGTAGHNMVGVGSILVGRNTARFEIWDGMRAIDYLQSRPDIDADRIGCMGNSGGGTQTAYLMALDERIFAAAPSCYLCSLYGRQVRTGAQDAEQNIFGQLAWGMDHTDYNMMRAPKPTLMCTATHDFFDIEDAWTNYRYAKRLYTRMGYGDRMSLLEADEKHGWTVRLREGGVRWMLRWLAGRDEPIFEPDGLQVLTDEEIQVTPRGQVMLIEGARSVYDLNRDWAAELAAQRQAAWSDGPPEGWRDQVRRLAGIRPLTELPEPTVHRLDVLPRDGYQVHPLGVRAGRGHPAAGTLVRSRRNHFTTGCAVSARRRQSGRCRPGRADSRTGAGGKIGPGRRSPWYRRNTADRAEILQPSSSRTRRPGLVHRLPAGTYLRGHASRRHPDRQPLADRPRRNQPFD